MTDSPATSATFSDPMQSSKLKFHEFIVLCYYYFILIQIIQMKTLIRQHRRRTIGKHQPKDQVKILFFFSLK